MSTVCLSVVLASFALLPKVYAAYVVTAALIGITGAGSTTFAYLAVLPAWFSKKFGMSLAFATMGIGLGQAIAPVYANWLIRELGWRSAYAALGFTVLAITVPNVLFFLRDKPPSAAITKNPVAAKLSGMSHREALRSPVFWRLAVCFCFVTIAVTGANVHIVPLLTDRGLSTTAAAATAALAGSALLVTRFATGILLDYVSARVLGVVTFTGCAIGIALILAGVPGLPTQLGVVLVGAALGVEGDLIAYITRRVFGTRSYGAIYGSLFAAFNIGVVSGPLVMGLSFDVFGSYTAGLKIILSLAAMSVLLLLPKLRYTAWETSPAPPNTEPAL